MRYKNMPARITGGAYIHPQDQQVPDACLDGYRLPGLIDIHFHGAFSWDFSFGGCKEIDEMLDKVMRTGLTGVYPTLITVSEEARIRALKDIAQVCKQRKSLPIIHGIHLEGPFLAPSRRGSHPLEYLMEPDLSLLDKWQEAADGLIKIITIAPELPGAMPFIKKASEMGITISLGHSDADWKTTEEAVVNGARHVTHLFNAMAPLHHRHPGMLTHILAERNLCVEIIGDCRHVAPETVRLVYNLFENNQIIVVSDAVAACGLTDGLHQLYDQTLKVQQGCCYIADTQLFGGSTILIECLARLNVEAGIPWGLLGTSAWRNPCTLLNLEAPDTEVYFDTEFNWIASRLEDQWFD